MREPDEHIVVRRAVVETEKRVDIDRRIWSHLIDQAGVQRPDPRLVRAGAHRIIKLQVATEVAGNGARKADRILPLHPHIAAVWLVQNVDPRLREQSQAPWQGVINRQTKTWLPNLISSAPIVCRYF